MQRKLYHGSLLSIGLLGLLRRCSLSSERVWQNYGGGRWGLRCRNTSRSAHTGMVNVLVLVKICGLMRGLRMATQLASSLGLLGVLLRVLLPAMHTHGHYHQHASGPQSAVASVCGCGVVHSDRTRVEHSEDPGTNEDPGTKRREFAVPLAEAHHCTACEIEVGIPCGCAPSSSPPVESPHCFGAVTSYSVAILVAKKVRLAQPRAPPSQRI